MQFGLIGKTLKHSFSAEIHPKLFDCKYDLIELDETELDTFMKAKEFIGINVTIPYKKSVMPYIDVLDDTAKMCGAVNTVVNKSGILYGYNTDFLGLKALIEKNNVSLKNKNVLILGGGATSDTATAVSKSIDAKNVVRLSRTVSDGFDTYDNISKYYFDTDVIINTTPVGMFPDIYNSLIDIKKFNNLTAVFDVVYNPIRTKLVCDAKSCGIIAEGGTYMLVFQAIYAARLFSGKEITKETGSRIFNEIIKNKQNIVLIGMPSCGKTTIGKELSKLLKRPFVDIDDEITKSNNITPRDIIEQQGENAFRDIETEIIKKFSKQQNLIISTGGGVVKREINIELLKENGIIVFLDRKLENLEVTTDRPITSSKDKLVKVFEERYPLYNKYSDIRFEVSENFEVNAAKLIKVIENEYTCN